MRKLSVRLLVSLLFVDALVNAAQVSERIISGSVSDATRAALPQVLVRLLDERGSINAAARQLGVSQPGLTKSLGTLEAVAGAAAALS